MTIHGQPGEREHQVKRGLPPSEEDRSCKSRKLAKDDDVHSAKTVEVSARLFTNVVGDSFVPCANKKLSGIDPDKVDEYLQLLIKLR